jgi:hypothetical protein
MQKQGLTKPLCGATHAHYSTLHMLTKRGDLVGGHGGAARRSPQPASHPGKLNIGVRP